MEIPLGIIDIAVLLLAMAASIFIGLKVAGKNNSVESYLLGDRNLPWWAILGSIVATETSAATVLSIPGIGFGATGFAFLQLALGYILGRVIVVYFLLPNYLSGNIVSAYEILHKQFGKVTTRLASMLFLVTRNLGDGLRLYLAAMVLQQLVGWPIIPSALAIGLLTLMYTYFGGMRSVVWNDCIQLIIYLSGCIVAAILLVRMLPHGWASYQSYMDATGKWNWIDWDMSLSKPYTLFAGLVGGTFLSLGSHGTDQIMVQRYLSAKNQRHATAAILASGIFVFLQFALVLWIGTLLGAFHVDKPLPEGIANDKVFAHFITHYFPPNTGLIGLMLAAILAATMSTLSSSLSSSASSAYSDLWLSGLKHQPSESSKLWFTRLATLIFGLIQIGIGVWASTFADSVVTNALTIAGFSSGVLLGWFFLGLFEAHVGQRAAIAGGIIGLGVLIWIQFILNRPDNIRISWPWLSCIGSLATFSTASFLAYLPIFKNPKS
jgi:SSS family transporter